VLRFDIQDSETAWHGTILLVLLLALLDCTASSHHHPAVPRSGSVARQQPNFFGRSSMLDEEDDDPLNGGGFGSIHMRAGRIPEGIRVAPSFLRTGRVISLPPSDFLMASGPNVVRLYEVTRLPFGTWNF
jgi:hypothetical protein